VKLLLATTSRGKAREQRVALAGVDLDIVSLAELPEVPPPEEVGPSFEANAAMKALYYARATGLAAVAEDAGLEVDALGGEPGIRSARWLGEDTPYTIKNERLLDLLRNLPEEARTARYVSAIALVENDEVVFETRKTCEGRIAFEASGENGFGYDPVFFYPPLGATFAEIPAEEKDRVSHRGRAMAELRRYLQER
jgi:XTP/dITP diphosphohydrolase